MENILEKLVVLALFLGIGFPVHEFSHALVAYWRGDATAKMMGRLTLNPVAHFDPMGGIFMALTLLTSGFAWGWAKPTPVNTVNLKNRKNDEVLVALAGPASNFLLAVAGALIIRVLVALGVQPPLFVANVFVMFLLSNLILAIFNFVPVPPLDGGSLLYRFLSPRQAWQIRPILAQYGMLIVLAVGLLGGQLIYGIALRVAAFLVGA